MKELIIDISARKIRNAKELKDLFRDLKDGKHLITIKDIRKRSLNQNAYYWSVVVPMVKDGLFDAGFDEVTTNEFAHEMLKQIHLTKRMVSKSTGDVVDLAGSSAALTITEFNDYIERICRWSAEYLGVVIPSPDEQYAVFAEYNEKLQESIIADDIE